MAVQKLYSDDKSICKVIFTISKEIAGEFDEIYLLGDFNNWDPKANHFTQSKPNGDYSTTIELPANNKYQFRYLADGEHWFNEEEADGQVPTNFGSKNSVIIL